jgi:hypothetical protein
MRRVFLKGLDWYMVSLDPRLPCSNSSRKITTIDGPKIREKELEINNLTQRCLYIPSPALCRTYTTALWSDLIIGTPNTGSCIW